MPEKLQECFALLVDSVVALQRENKEILWGSMVKETMKRKKPSFNETYYGFRTFSQLLEDAQRRGDRERCAATNARAATSIEDLGAASIAPSSRSESEAAQVSAAAEASTDANEGRPSRRRRSRGRRPRTATAATDTGEAGDEGDDGEETEHEEATAGQSHDSESRPAEPDGAAARASNGSGSPEQAPTERPIFSFLSWIRRETSSPRSDESAKKPATEPTEDKEH